MRADESVFPELVQPEPHPPDYRPPIRSSWQSAHFMRRGVLTDKRIAYYQKRGFYSPEFQQARREFLARKSAKRSGNFIKAQDGHLIYSPQ